MKSFEFVPEMVCPRLISFDLEGNVAKNIKFTGGCNGNLKAIATLVEGKPVEEIVGALKGNTCGMKGTSCADQLALALEQAAKEQLKA